MNMLLGMRPPRKDPLEGSGNRPKTSQNPLGQGDLPIKLHTHIIHVHVAELEILELPVCPWKCAKRLTPVGYAPVEWMPSTCRTQLCCRVGL